MTFLLAKSSKATATMSSSTIVLALITLATISTNICYCLDVYDLTHVLYNGMTAGSENLDPRYLGSYVFNQTGFRKVPTRSELTQQAFTAYESAGTHMDAPYRANSHQWKVQDISADRLVAPLVVIRSKEGVQRKHIDNWERTNGIIPENSVVLLDSGWSNYWSAENKFRGYDTIKQTYDYPGFSYEACTTLVQKKVVGIGVDTMAIDGSRYVQRKIECLRHLSDYNIYMLKNVKISKDVPDSGATIFVGALNMKEAAGSPVRLMAAVFPSSSIFVKSQGLLIALSVLIGIFSYIKL